jgi:hypothetical protein
MDKNQIVLTQDWHVERLSSTMQQEDVDAVWALGHLSPKEALSVSAAASVQTFTYLHKGDVACIFGYSSHDRTACPWMLASPLVRKSPRWFLEATKQFYSNLLDKHDVLVNVIDARHTRSLKWIEWCGAVIHPATPMGPEGLPFHRHETRR